MASKKSGEKKAVSAVRKFLDSMMAMSDAIPEELVKDGEIMVEKVEEAFDEVGGTTEVITEKKEFFDEGRMMEMVEKIVTEMMAEKGVQDTSMNALDELEKEVVIEKEMKDADNEEAVIVDPETVRDSANAVRDIIKAVKPVIAQVKDAKNRKILADSVARLARLNANDSQYANVFNAAKNSAQARDAQSKQTKMSDTEIGDYIWRKHNPHAPKGEV